MGSLPKHKKITEELLKLVSRAESGDQLPTIRKLMADYDASQASIVRSLDDLASQGLIRRQRGSGIYVEGDTRRSRILGVYLDVEQSDYSNLLFLKGVRLAAQREGFHVADFGPQNPYEDQESVLKSLAEMGFAGLVISLSTANYFHLEWPGWLEYLRKIRLPIVSCRPIPTLNADVVIPDFFSVFEKLGEALRQQDVMKVRFVGSLTISALTRFEGLKVGLGKDAVLETEMFDETSDEAYKRVRRMVEAGWTGHLVIGVPPPSVNSLEFLTNGPWKSGSDYSLSLVVESIDMLPPGVEANLVVKSSPDHGEAVAERLIARIRGDRSAVRYDIYSNELTLASDPLSRRRHGGPVSPESRESDRLSGSEEVRSAP